MSRNASRSFLGARALRALHPAKRAGPEEEPHRCPYCADEPRPPHPVDVADGFGADLAPHVPAHLKYAVLGRIAETAQERSPTVDSPR